MSSLAEYDVKILWWLRNKPDHKKKEIDRILGQNCVGLEIRKFFCLFAFAWEFNDSLRI